MLSWQRVQWGHLFCPVFGPSTIFSGNMQCDGQSWHQQGHAYFFFFSKIRSVSPEPFPKTNIKLLDYINPQWWHQRVIVPKWKDKHSKTIRIYYILFTHHNGTILEQLSGRVNERKGTKTKKKTKPKNQNKSFTALSQQANLKVIVHTKMKIQSLFTQPHIFSNAYTFDFSVEYKVESLRNI